MSAAAAAVAVARVNKLRSDFKIKNKHLQSWWLKNPIEYISQIVSFPKVKVKNSKERQDVVAQTKVMTQERRAMDQQKINLL